MVRVPADRIAHLFRPLRPGQIRGEPWLARALVKLDELDQYDDAALVKAKVAALFTGFVVSPDPEDAVMGGDEPDEDGVVEASLEPGTMQRLSPGQDVRFTVTPLTTAAMAAAQAEARKRLDGLQAQAKERTEAGLALDGLPDLSDDGAREGQYQALLIHSLAARHITAWSGIEDDPPVTRENVAALMDLYPVGERFIQEFTLRQVLLASAKNASGPSADGTSSQAVGPDTAKPVRKRARPAPKAASA